MVAEEARQMIVPEKSIGTILEVIACSVEDAIEAEEGGADRLEIIRDLGAGGFTPTLDLVRGIQSRVKLPLRVMLREEPGFNSASPESIDKMCRMATELNELNIDGVVIGFLVDGMVNIHLAAKVVSFAPDLAVTFHHAFEDALDKGAAIREIKRIDRVDRILSHGGFGAGNERVDTLSADAAVAGSEIQIVAGGRIDLQMIKALREKTEIREFHVGTAARENGNVSSSRVKALAAAAQGTYD